MRRFSSYGPVDKDLHYYVPRTELIGNIRDRLRGEPPEKGGHYITVWAPRQSGKTWVMREVLWELEKDPRFSALKVNLEALKTETDPEGAVRAIASEMRKLPDGTGAAMEGPNRLSALFRNTVLKRPLILILDEFDALEESVISDLVSVFRNLFIERGEDRADAFHKEYLLHGIALIGVRAVIGVENVKGSPFNVQRSIHIPNLTREEVRSMFRWYERESGQTVEPEVIDRVFFETRGQPGLVSWFGELLTETYNANPAGPIAMADFEHVFRRAVHALPNNNILNIISKAKQEPYREAVITLFKTDRKIEFSFDDPLQNFLYMNGVIDIDEADEELFVRFSCPFVQKRLFHYFSRDLFQTMDHLYDPMADIGAVVGEKGIDVPGLIALYQTYLDRNRYWLLRNAPRRKTDLRIYEAVFHFNLYLYLKAFFQDKGGEVFPEFPTGNGKIDLLIRYKERLYALELKSFRDRYAFKRSLARAAEYARQLGVKEIHLVLFIETIDDGDRRELEVVYGEGPSGPTVRPLFVETGDVRG